MALSMTQLSQHIRQHIPRLEDVNKYVDRYITSHQVQVQLFPIPQKIHYWSSKVAEHVHVCIDLLLPEFNNFTIVVMMRWLTIGHALYELTDIWKHHKMAIKTHACIKEWLPEIVKRKLPPNLIPRGSYSQLRKYVRLWHKRHLVTAIPKLRGEYTHRLDEMNRWIREFEKKVTLIAVQRDVAVPEDVDEQIELYKVYLTTNDDDTPSTDEDDDECPILDNELEDSEQESLNEFDDHDAGSDAADESSDDESIEPPHLSRRDQQIEKYRDKIKTLQTELRALKKTLRFTQGQHCRAARERHVLRELQKNHKTEMDALHETLAHKTQQLINLTATNVSLRDALVETKRFLQLFKTQLLQSRKLHQQIIDEKSKEKSAETHCSHQMDTDGMDDDTCMSGYCFSESQAAYIDLSQATIDSRVVNPNGYDAVTRNLKMNCRLARAQDQLSDVQSVRSMDTNTSGGTRRSNMSSTSSASRRSNISNPISCETSLAFISEEDSGDDDEVMNESSSRQTAAHQKHRHEPIRKRKHLMSPCHKKDVIKWRNSRNTS